MRELVRSDEDYPKALIDLSRPPEPLYALGDTSILRLAPDRIAAIVGTRDASPYGLRIAGALAAALSAAGIGVVSGLARGIDSSAHRGTLEAGGKTIAVLGTGVDVPYPVGNRALHEAIVTHGLVLSENPPGAPAAVGCFPRRNRIIAALARVTIVVEAPYKSGAINTATQALDMARVVAAVPGPIDSPRSRGANLLIRDGAQLIGTVDDALGLFGMTRNRKSREDGRNGKNGENGKNEPPDARVLGSLETAVWDALASGPAPVAILGERSGLPVRQVLEGIARLELCGMVAQRSGGEVERADLGME